MTNPLVVNSNPHHHQQQQQHYHQSINNSQPNSSTNNINQSIFKSTKYTNYSLTQRIWNCFMYILTVFLLESIFYGQEKETVIGSLTLISQTIQNERDSKIKKQIINSKIK